MATSWETAEVASTLVLANHLLSPATQRVLSQDTAILNTDKVAFLVGGDSGIIGGTVRADKPSVGKWNLSHFGAKNSKNLRC